MKNPTLTRKADISCARCGFSGPVVQHAPRHLWADLFSEFLPKLLDGTFFHVACPRCGARHDSPFAVTLVSLEHKCKITLLPCADEKSRRAARAHMKAPGLREDPVLVRRIVTSAEQLAEKFRILEHGLCDKRFELLRIRAEELFVHCGELLEIRFVEWKSAPSLLLVTAGGMRVHRFGGLQLEWLSMRISLPENFLINRNWARQHRWRFVQDALLGASRCPLGLIGL